MRDKVLILLVATVLSGCGSFSSNYPAGASGEGLSTIPQLGHKSYCSLVNLSDRPWPPHGMALVEPKESNGEITLESGQIIPWKSFALFPRERWNGKVLWFFHGVCGDGDFTLSNKSEATLQIYREFSGGKPIVIGVSLGQAWLLNSELLPGVWGVLSDLQKTYRLPRSRSRNWLFGFSMGGFNALALFGDSSRSIHFDKCVVVAPCLPGCNPYGSTEELQQFYESPNGKRILKKNTIQFVQNFFPDTASWEAANPLVHHSRYHKDNLLLVAGDQDIFGFQVPTEKLASEIGAPFVSFSGKHTVPADPETVKTIAHFFESRKTSF